MSRISLTILALALLGGAFTWYLLRPSAVQVTNSQLGAIDPVASPDGMMIAYREIVPESPNTGWLKLLDFRGERPSSRVLLRGGAFYGGVSWSPNGKSLSYTNWEPISEGSSLVRLSVFKFDLSSGSVTRLVDGRLTSPISEYTSWSKDGRIAFATSTWLMLTNAAGDPPKQLCKLPPIPSASQIEFLAWSPDGIRIAFSLERDEESDADLARESNLWLLDTHTCEASNLTSSFADVGATWKNADDLIFVRSERASQDYALHRVSTKTHDVTRLSDRGIDFCPSFSMSNGALFYARGDRWNPTNRDFNLFRGFNIWKRQRPADAILSWFRRTQDTD